MTEMALGMMISVMRGFGEQDRAMRHGQWPESSAACCSGKTLGVLGLGRLGGELATVSRFLGMRVIAAGLTLTAPRSGLPRHMWSFGGSTSSSPRAT